MVFDSWKPVIKFQTALGGVSFILSVGLLSYILDTLRKYHDQDRLNFNCDPKPSDFIKQRCYDSYISTVTEPYGLIPQYFVAITLGGLCLCGVSFAICGPVALRKRPGDRNNRNAKRFLRIYFIHVFLRILFLGVMLGLVCSYHTLSLPSVFKCDEQTNSQTTPSPLNQTKISLQCNDHRHKEKSDQTIAFISVCAIVIVLSICEVLHLRCKRKNFLYALIGDTGDYMLLPCLPEKPTITNRETEVDEDFIITWSEAGANSSNCSIKYRLEWRKQPMTGSTEMVQRENIVETHLKITDLEYDTEYEVKLFAVNEQGDSEPDVRTFKTKSGLPEKPIITNTETKVDKDLIVTWSEAEVNSSYCSIKYRLECRKQSMTGPTKVFQQGDIVETRHTITGLEYDTEYEVKLFAVNEQGDSEPDVRRFKTKSGLPEKPTITNTEIEVDKDLIVTWSEAEVNSSNYSIKYRLEWRKQPMTTSTENFQRGNIVETRHTITGLEYDTEYEVKLFAVNEQGDSEPDVRRFKTKSAVSAYTSALKSSIMYHTEFQPKLIASRTISNVKTDQIFTNLLIQHGRKALIRSNNDETCYSRSEELEYYGKVSGTPVKHCSEIFLGVIDDQESTNSILVVGKAGIGKSLFCHKVIRDWANNELFQARENTEIPNLKFVYLLTFRQLNLLENTCVTLREILNCCSALDDKCNIDDSTFEYILKHPKEVMIILDGYDEYSQQDYIAGNLEEQHPSNARRKMRVAALCSKLIKGKILRGAIVMITSRPDESDKMGGIRFKRYVEIAGFSSEQVKEYVEKYFEKNENMKNAVLKHVMNNENLVSLAHIPMLCYLLCLEMEYTLTESENPDDLPVSTTDVYTKLIEIFELKHYAESEYKQKEIPEQFKAPPVIKDTIDKLSKLAAKLLVERKPTFDEREMEGDFEAEEVSKLKGSGLLYCGQPFRTELITTTKHFSFTHLTVQEFLAARRFVKENRVPDKECSEMVVQFFAGVLSSEGNEELMEKLLNSPFMHRDLKRTCLTEYQNKEFAKKFIRNNPQALCNSDGVMASEGLSDVDCIGVSFVLDIISELNKEEAREAQRKCSDKFVTVQKLKLRGSQLTLSGIQRICNSLNNEHCLVSELDLLDIYLADECVDVINRLVVRKLTKLTLVFTKITDTGVASLCKALQHPSCKLTTLDLLGSYITATGVASLWKALQQPSCKLTTLGLRLNSITDTDVASLREALQHPSCKLTTLNLQSSSITDTGVASLCKALQHRSCKLTTLNLLGSSITNTGVASLREALQHPSCKLTTLSLESSYITDIGVARLCKALQHQSCKLTTLNLPGGFITDTVVASLCQALQHPSCKLTTLNLQSSNITDTVVASLCKALQHPSCKLTTLNLGENYITDTGGDSLCEALQHPSCKLTTLNLQSINITDTVVASLCRALQHPSCKLTTLNLGENHTTDTGFARLCEALQHPSCKLTTLYLPLIASPECRAILKAVTQRHRPALNLCFDEFY